MKYKRIISMIAAGVMTLSFMSCSSDNSENKSVAVGTGEEVVVATSVAVTEILDALGVKVSGVPSTSYELPESTEGAVEIGNPMSPDLEIIKSLNPTVVVSVDTLGSDYMNLFIENNIPSEFVSLESLDGLKEAIISLGERFDKDDEATALINEIQAKELAMLNPDKILVMVHALPEETKAALEAEMATDSAWQNIDAVKEGNVVYLDSEYFGMSANLKVIEGLDMLSDIVHGIGE